MAKIDGAKNCRFQPQRVTARKAARSILWMNAKSIAYLKARLRCPTPSPPGNPSRTVCVCGVCVACVFELWRKRRVLDSNNRWISASWGNLFPFIPLPSLHTFIHCESSLTHWKPTVSAAHKFSLVRTVRPAGLQIDDTSRRLRASQSSDKPLGERHVARVWPNLTNKKPQQTSFGNPETIEVKRKLVVL